MFGDVAVAIIAGAVAHPHPQGDGHERKLTPHLIGLSAPRSRRSPLTSLTARLTAQRGTFVARQENRTSGPFLSLLTLHLPDRASNQPLIHASRRCIKFSLIPRPSGR